MTVHKVPRRVVELVRNVALKFHMVVNEVCFLAGEDLAMQRFLRQQSTAVGQEVARQTLFLLPCLFRPELDVLQWIHGCKSDQYELRSYN